MRALQDHLAGRTSIFFATFRLPPGSASERWINTRGSVIAFDRQNRPLLLSGSSIDVTDRRQTKLISDRQLQIIESTTDFALTSDMEGRVLYANAAVLRFCGQPDLAAVAKQRIDALLPCCCEPTPTAILAALPVADIWNGEIQLTSAPAAATPAWTGSGLVLVVDDAPGVQRVAARMLQGSGFTTLPASDGAEAVVLLRQHADRLCLVLLDLIMPRKDGVETFGELQHIAPAVPVVLMSGFVGNLNLDRFPTAKPAGMLAKPFTHEALQARIREALGRN